MTDLNAKKYGVISLGCDKNRVDAEKLLAIIKSRGCEICDDLSEANVVVVNTCAFLNSARKEAIETILDCASYKEGNLEKIVVTGCLPQKFVDDTFDALTEADVFLGVNDYDKFFDALNYALPLCVFEDCRRLQQPLHILPHSQNQGRIRQLSYGAAS